jgi:hypothetical protein
MDSRDSGLTGAAVEQELRLVRAKRKALQRDLQGCYSSVSIQLQQVRGGRGRQPRFAGCARALCASGGAAYRGFARS